MRLLEGRVTIITGAGRGSGRACAELFAAHGARVIASDIDPHPALESDYVSGQVLEVTGGI